MLLVGSNLRPDMGKSRFVEPTCFVDVTNDIRIAQEEISRPVLAVIPFEDDEDAICIANDNIYGLSGGRRSGDVERALRIAWQSAPGQSGSMAVCQSPAIYRSAGINTAALGAPGAWKGLKNIWRQKPSACAGSNGGHQGIYARKKYCCALEICPYPIFR